MVFQSYALYPHMIVEHAARTLTRLRAARGLGLSRAKSGVPDFAIRNAEAGNTPLRWGEEKSAAL
jgi:ABC-type Fe3+/spermidine/putrescine transport system ATPase subunit